MINDAAKKEKEEGECSSLRLIWNFHVGLLRFKSLQSALSLVTWGNDDMGGAQVVELFPYSWSSAH